MCTPAAAHFDLGWAQAYSVEFPKLGSHWSWDAHAHPPSHAHDMSHLILYGCYATAGKSLLKKQSSYEFEVEPII